MMKSYGLDLQEVQRLYVDDKLSLSALAKRFNLTPGIIRHRLRKMGTVLRPSFKGKQEDFGITKEFLEKEYIEKQKPYKQIAEEIGCSESNVWYKLKQFQLLTRTKSEIMTGKKFSVSHREALSQAHLEAGKKRRGVNNPNWRGGVAAKNFLERYKSEYVVWRRRVIRHKGSVCSLCGKDLTERCPCCNRSTDKHVHHIQEFAENPDLRYSLDNVIVLCEACHRAYHKKQGL
jgi:DNA-binding Lrp family transcriptional regulator